MENLNKLYNLVVLKNRQLLRWYMFVPYYFLLRFIFGIEYSLIYGFCIILIIFRISFEYIALIFFIIAMIVYVLGSNVEANHYFSFVYGFITLSVLKYFYLLAREILRK